MGINRFAVGDRAQRLPQLSGLTALLPTTVALISLASLLLLVQTSRVTSAGYDIGRLEKTREEWKQRIYQLESEIADLQSLEHIKYIAENELGMVPATQHFYIEIDEPSQVNHAPEMHSPAYEKPELEIQATGWWQKVLNFITLWRDRVKDTE